jgi:hypothetical protein
MLSVGYVGYQKTYPTYPTLMDWMGYLEDYVRKQHKNIICRYIKNPYVNMSSSDEMEMSLKKEKYNEYMRNYRLLNPDKVRKIGKRKYYKHKFAGELTADDIAKYKEHLDIVCRIKRAIKELLDESPETAYAVVQDTIKQLEAN